MKFSGSSLSNIWFLEFGIVMAKNLFTFQDFLVFRIAITITGLFTDRLVEFATIELPINIANMPTIIKPCTHPNPRHACQNRRFLSLYGPTVK